MQCCLSLSLSLSHTHIHTHIHKYNQCSRMIHGLASGFSGRSAALSPALIAIWSASVIRSLQAASSCKTHFPPKIQASVRMHACMYACMHVCMYVCNASCGGSQHLLAKSAAPINSKSHNGNSLSDACATRAALYVTTGYPYRWMRPCGSCRVNASGCPIPV